MKSINLAAVLFGLIATTLMASEKPEAQKTDPVKLTESGETVTLSNRLVALQFDFGKRSYSITDAASREVLLDNAWMSANELDFRRPEEGWKITHRCEPVADLGGRGMSVLVAFNNPANPALPSYLFRYTLHENQGAVVMGYGVGNIGGSQQKINTTASVQLKKISPLTKAASFPGETLEHPLTLNGSAGAEAAQVGTGINRESWNSLMLTGLVKGKRRTIVWGGLAYKEFGKFAAVHDGALEMNANDPVGRLVDAAYWSEDTFYLDAITADPFDSLERFGRAMRAANHAHPNVYDFPVLCGWGVGALSGLPSVNNSKALVGELEAAQKCGFTKYTKVGIRLEPDTYCTEHEGNTEQGWWDDEHWAKYGHQVPPYETFAKWCAAIRERGGIPYTYFQMGMPSDDYAKAFPGQMLFNNIDKLGIKHPHNQPLVSYDYTDPDFQKHMQEVWGRLRKDGMRGIKFDYPETAWRPEGGFENRHATTAFAYREAFRLAREGLGADAFLDERNLGESGRPCLDVTAGLVDTQRNWWDSNKFVPEMVTIGGLRWYKNRTVFNYYPDSKTVHDCSPEIRRSMLTMVYLTSGRIDLATSFTLFTPEVVHDFSRIYPAYREAFTARPLDAFTGVANPQVYDLERNPDWHQVALFNAGGDTRAVSVELSGDRVTTGAIGLEPAAEYYLYEFWSDELIGKLSGTARLAMELGPSHCAMLSVRKVQPVPQVLSTNRHVLQGWVDLPNVKWNAGVLSGEAKVTGGEPFQVVLACNGSKPLRATAVGARASLKAHPAGPGFVTLVLERADNGPDVSWKVEFGARSGIDSAPTQVPVSGVKATREDSFGPVEITWQGSKALVEISRDGQVLVTGLAGHRFVDSTLDEGLGGRNVTYAVTQLLPDGKRGPVQQVTYALSKRNPVAEPPAPQVSVMSLTPASAATGWGSIGVGRDAGGGPLNVGGKVYSDGVGMHAPAEVVYACKPEWKRFVATVGIDESQRSANQSSLSFEVWAVVDGKRVRLDRSPLLIFGKVESWRFNVPVPPKSEKLILSVTDGGDGNKSDHADWVNAGFLTE
jgi:hypothetical protein